MFHLSDDFLDLFMLFEFSLHFHSIVIIVSVSFQYRFHYRCSIFFATMLQGSRKTGITWKI